MFSFPDDFGDFQSSVAAVQSSQAVLEEDKYAVFQAAMQDSTAVSGGGTTHAMFLGGEGGSSDGDDRYSALRVFETTTPKHSSDPAQHLPQGRDQQTVGASGVSFSGELTIPPSKVSVLSSNSVSSLSPRDSPAPLEQGARTQPQIPPSRIAHSSGSAITSGMDIFQVGRAGEEGVSFATSFDLCGPDAQTSVGSMGVSLQGNTGSGKADSTGTGPLGALQQPQQIHLSPQQADNWADFTAFSGPGMGGGNTDWSQPSPFSLTSSVPQPSSSTSSSSFAQNISVATQPPSFSSSSAPPLIPTTSDKKREPSPGGFMDDFSEFSVYQSSTHTQESGPRAALGELLLPTTNEGSGRESSVMSQLSSPSNSSLTPEPSKVYYTWSTSTEYTVHVL